MSFLGFIFYPIVILLFFKNYRLKIIKIYSLIYSILCVWSALILNLFIMNIFQYEIFFYKNIKFLWNDFYNIQFFISIDSISIYFIIITILLINICLIYSWQNIKYKIKDFIIILFTIQFLLINLFLTINLMFFYIFFESILIPMFLLIVIWGTRQRKIHAVYMFFFYTFTGSLCMLFAIISIYNNFNTLNLLISMNINITWLNQLIYWLLFFIAFCIKVPLFPFHIRLPEAHVEAPTVGSVSLAGILLKLGTYGMIRFLIPLFSYANYFFIPCIYSICILSIIYISFTALRQIDLKKIIAYASIAHMSYVIIGLFSNNLSAFLGSIYLMLSHALVSSGLFSGIGILYDRYKTRSIKYYSNLVSYMPIFSACFLFLILANISFPGTSNFIGEFLILLGIVSDNIYVSLITTSGIIIGVIYPIWLYNRIIFGVFSKYLVIYTDLIKKEFFVSIYLIILILYFGLIPNSILFYLEYPLLFSLLFKSIC